ncbi:MAG TPA: RNA chaperone Hfq [Spirochaetota bacterium]|jgi:host factor-I protein|nr:RNA chaperone Hfq [Spirochaetota bacterium]HON16971.1 RNA chaperone Hfq [Spirochaetota bacterium]HOV08567.1 RNA chaperone Hfq [Spirochaetota bacterium]HPD78264.1 RNA chaperone Hfq [Spirochaetota bacterium]HPP95383.1 RNA chaperone Hfq [Spirochaetota bacterium]
MSKQVNNLQDVFLNSARKNKTEITVFLVNGVPIKGRVVSFDNFTILLEVDKKQNLIYKHAISTMVPSKLIPFKEEDDD